MAVTALFHLFAFSCLSAYATASPFTYQPSSPLVDTVNSTNNLYPFLNVPAQANITVPAVDVWPPAPPPNPLRYQVPDSKVSVEFSRQRLPAGGLNQPDVQTVLNAAFADCEDHAPKVQVPLSPQDWTSGQVTLQRTARNIRRGEPTLLTYGDWCTAVMAIQGFVEHYRGIDFLYNVYGDNEGVSLALGALRNTRAPLLSNINVSRTEAFSSR